MRKKIKIKNIASLLFIIALVSYGGCQNQSAGDGFDWDGPERIKQELIRNLKSGVEPNDVLIMNFLNSYSKLQEEFNDTLYKQNNFDSLNTIAYSPSGATAAVAVKFKKKAEQNGYKLAQSEGMIYITKNMNFVKAGIIDLLDTMSVEFLNLYSLEIDSICCEDAALIISSEELVKRIYNWGEFINEANHIKYKTTAENQYKYYISILYMGLNNSPSFGWETNEYNSDYFDLMTKLVKDKPNSSAAKVFEPFIELLLSEKMTLTPKVNSFIEKIIK